jgi:hypothetical protein
VAVAIGNALSAGEDVNMKKVVFLCLCVLALCFCYCKKSQSSNSDATEESDTLDVSAYDCCDICAGAARVSPRALGGYCDSCKCASSSPPYVPPFEPSAEQTPEPSADYDDFFRVESEEEIAKGVAEWKAAMYDTVLSALRLAFNNDESDDTASAINAVYETIKKDMDIIGETWELNAKDLKDVGFTIMYKDDNYLTSMFNGLVYHRGWPSPNHLMHTVMVDIKNKKRLTLSDVVEIDNTFVKVVYNGLKEFLQDYTYGDIGMHYTMKTLKESLLKTDVWIEDEDGTYRPWGVSSYFDAEKLVILISVVNALGRVWGIDLPLDKIRTMIILPNFPAAP